jgi:hypothetical protein
MAAIVAVILVREGLGHEVEPRASGALFFEREFSRMDTRMGAKGWGRCSRQGGGQARREGVVHR